MELSQKYGRTLSHLTGDELENELRSLIDFVAEPTTDQRTKDRGSYLVLENLNRLNDDGHTIRGLMFYALSDANPHASRGVKSRMESWREKDNERQALLSIAFSKDTPASEHVTAIHNIAQSYEGTQDIHNALVSWKLESQLPAETAALLLEKGFLYGASDLYLMYPHLDEFIDLLFALTKRRTHPKLFHGNDIVVKVTTAFSVTVKHESEQAPLVAFYLYERIMEEFEDPEEQLWHLRMLMDYTKVLMPGFSERIKRERGFDQKWMPSLPTVEVADATAAEALVRKNTEYIRQRLGTLCGDYRLLWEAAALTVQFHFTQHQTKIWQIAMKEQLFDLAALLAVGMGSTEWQNEVIRCVRENRRWERDDRAYDALIVLLRHVAVDSDDFVNEVLTTDRPQVMRLYA